MAKQSNNGRLVIGGALVLLGILLFLRRVGAQPPGVGIEGINIS